MFWVKFLENEIRLSWAGVGFSTNIQIYLGIYWENWVIFRKYWELFRLSPMMSLFSLDNAQFYARNNRVQQFLTWKMYFNNFTSLQRLKLQCSKIARTGNREVYESVESSFTIARKFDSKLTHLGIIWGVFEILKIVLWCLESFFENFRSIYLWIELLSLLAVSPRVLRECYCKNCHCIWIKFDANVNYDGLKYFILFWHLVSIYFDSAFLKENNEMLWAGRRYRH